MRTIDARGRLLDDVQIWQPFLVRVNVTISMSPRLNGCGRILESPASHTLIHREEASEHSGTRGSERAASKPTTMLSKAALEGIADYKYKSYVSRRCWGRTAGHCRVGRNSCGIVACAEARTRSWTMC